MNFDDYHDIHIPAVILKTFLRELPQPLLTFECYDQILGITSEYKEVVEKCVEQAELNLATLTTPQPLLFANRDAVISYCWCFSAATNGQTHNQNQVVGLTQTPALLLTFAGLSVCHSVLLRAELDFSVPGLHLYATAQHWFSNS